MSTESKHVTKHIPARTYIAVFVALAIVTAIEVAITGFIANEGLKIIVLLALAAAKALLVMMFFMHLKYDTKAYSVLLIFPLFMAVLLAAVVLIAAASA
jgi:cytochrome c oxidase subunit 4